MITNNFFGREVAGQMARLGGPDLAIVPEVADPLPRTSSRYSYNTVILKAFVNHIFRRCVFSIVLLLLHLSLHLRLISEQPIMPKAMLVLTVN